MASEAIYLMLPVGRCVFTDERTKDDKGVPLTHADGKPKTVTTVGIAIKKGAETHWRETEWGRQLDAKAREDWKGNHPDRPSFSWKIEDGDSDVPNKKGNKNNERDGWPGHWVIKPSTNFAVKLVDKAGGPINLTMADVYAGCYVQAYVSSKGNSNDESSGIYVNLEVLAFNANGEKIEGTGGVDPTTLGFGQSPTPAGATSTPPGMSSGKPAPPPREEFSAGAIGAPPPPPTSAPPPPPPPAADTLTDKARAAGATSEADVLAWQGWTREALVQHGYLTA